MTPLAGLCDAKRLPGWGSRFGWLFVSAAKGQRVVISIAFAEGEVQVRASRPAGIAGAGDVPALCDGIAGRHEEL